MIDRHPHSPKIDYGFVNLCQEIINEGGYVELGDVPPYLRRLILDGVRPTPRKEFMDHIEQFGGWNKDVLGVMDLAEHYDEEYEEDENDEDVWS